jgi:hypothetical protein
MLTDNNANEYALSDSLFAVPEVPSYLIGADNHQIGATGASIVDPTTWGDRADNAFKFSVSALTRAVTSTLNSAVAVGELVGVADESNRADTGEWLQGMDDDLAQYYRQNQNSVDTVGDVIGMFAPGLAGMKLLNMAQKGIALASEGRAGLSLAAHFGTLPTKQAVFAAAAKAEISAGTGAYSLINGNLAKSLAAGYAQSALEFAAFDTAAALTMKDSPLFVNHDMSDIAYNALLGGGFIGAGVMGTAIAVRTVMDMKRAGNVIDKATHDWRTVRNEVTKEVPANEAVAWHLNNIENIPAVDPTDPLSKLKLKGAAEVKLAELDAGRLATQKLVKGDAELGNVSFDILSLSTSEDVANKLAGAVRISRAGREIPEVERMVKAGTHDSKYIKFFGEDAGNVYDAPKTLRLADKLDNEAEVLATARSYKHKQGQVWAVSTAKDADEVEARYIMALTGNFDPKVAIAGTDIPFLERGYKELVANPALETIALKDGTKLDRTGLWNHLEELKGAEANKILAINNISGEAALTTEDIAKMVNISASELKSGIRPNASRPETAMFAMQGEADTYTAKLIAAGKWKEDKGTIKTYLQPQFAKVTYDMEKADLINNHEISGMVALKEEQRIYREQTVSLTDNYDSQFGDKNASFAGLSLSTSEDVANKSAVVTYPNQINPALMRGANRESVGGGLFTAQNSGYKLLGSYMQQLGVMTAFRKQKLAERLADTFSAPGHAVLNDPAASTELWRTVQQLRQTPEKYELVAGRGLVNIKQMDYEAKLAAAAKAGKSEAELAKLAKPVFEDTKAPVEIALNTKGMQDWAATWNTYHKNHLAYQSGLRNSQGLVTQESLQRIFYVPPVDSRQFPYYAFVVDDSITGTGHVSMIHANTAADLEALAAKIPTERGLKVIYKDQSERWHKAAKDYDYDLGINENYIDSILKRSGVSAPYNVRTDAKLLHEELMQWRGRQDVGLLYDMVEHRYAPEFAELRRQGAQYDLARTSTKGYVADKFKAAQSNPYTDYIKSALDISRDDTTPIWSAVNRLAETGISSAVNKLSDTFKSVITPADLEEMNKELQSIGCSVFEDAATYALANHTAPKPVLSNWIRQANSLLTFTMLRSDPMNALNNGFGHGVLYGTELKAMIQDVMATGAEGTAAIKAMGHMKLPGTPNTVLSPAKFAANAYGEFFRNIIGREDKGQLYNYFKQLNLLPSYTDQFGQMMGHLTLEGGETAVQLSERMNKALAAGKKIGEFTEKVSGNKVAEEMNRFVAAHTAYSVAQEAVKRGVITQDMVPSIINTFVNRVNGVVLASQRPLLFRGPVGQAVGLFQTYQFNMLQQLFRYVGEGKSGRVATLLGLQGSLYGMNGLPAFNAMNNFLVGNAAGNVEHQDVITATYDAAGKEVGDWLLYGAASNFLLHPDLKINTYSRGDINPRQVTVIPTTFADVPIIGAATKFFGSMYETAQKIDKGADVWGAVIQGVEHSGISRPLAGFAQAMEATTNEGMQVYSTDNAGNIGMHNDLFSATTAARLMGAKPLDEAVAFDALHRITVYKAADTKRLNTLGEAIKTTTAAGNAPDQDQINTFIGEYMKAGGKQQQFAQFYHQQVLGANKSKVNQMIDNGNNFQSRYMQKIMGGYQLQDFANTRVQPTEPTSEE